MKNLEIGISETEKGFVVIPADEYSDMACQSVPFLLRMSI